MSRRSDRFRDTIRQRGASHHRHHEPMLPIPRTPHPDQPSRAERQAEADRAMADWRARQAKTGD